MKFNNNRMRQDSPHYLRVYLNQERRFPDIQILQLYREGVLYRPTINRLVERVFEPEDAYRGFPAAFESDSFRFILCTGGETSIRSGDSELSLREGDLLLQSPGRQGSIKPRRPASFALRIIQLDWLSREGLPLYLGMDALIRILYGGVYVQKEKIVLSPSRFRRWSAIFDHLYRHRVDSEMILPLTELLQALREELHPGDPAATEVPESGDVRIAAALRWMEEQPAQPIVVDRLAALCNLSRSQFLRRFKKASGASPVKYQQHLRIEAARALLALSDRSCAQIAEELGFTDAAYFSTLFKREVGMPPREFRRRSGAY